MAAFKDIRPGYPFAYDRDGIVGIGKFFVKDPNGDPTAETGTASVVYFSGIKDGALQYLPTGEPEQTFSVYQTVIDMVVNDKKDGGQDGS